MSEDSGFIGKKKPQMKAPRVTPLEGVSTYAPGIRVRGVENPQGFGIDERRCGLDLFCSLGEGMFAKENIETLRDSLGLTPLHPVSDIQKNNIKSGFANEGFQATESTETRRLFSGSSVPLSLWGDIHKKNMKSDYSDEGLSTTEGTDILGNSSGLTPLHSGSEIFKRRVIK